MELTLKTFHKFSRMFCRSTFPILIEGDNASTLEATKSFTDAAKIDDCTVFNNISVKIVYHFSCR